jgi:hypothetical protein
MPGQIRLGRVLPITTATRLLTSIGALPFSLAHRHIAAPAAPAAPGSPRQLAASGRKIESLRRRMVEDDLGRQHGEVPALRS